MSESFIVHFLGSAPIPVGNRVEVRVFLVDTAVFGTKLEPDFNDPLIVDLDTGIVYGQGWHFEAITALLPGGVRPELPLAPRADLQEHGRWQGRITSTRIAWLSSSADKRYAQTSFTITLEGDAQPYR
jgi:hypothetical protein